MDLKKNIFACAKNKIKLSNMREKYCVASRRPKRLRFFDELNEKAQEFAIQTERDGGERFDWDDARILTEDFKTQLAECGFCGVEVYWSLGYCQGDGVAFYGCVFTEDLKEKDEQAGILIERLEAAGDEISIEITGANSFYHHRNSMCVEIDFLNEIEDDELPARLKIARPLWREAFEQYLSGKVRQISQELEKSGYAEIEYRCDENTIRDELLEREHLYEKDGTQAMSEFEFSEWQKTQNSTFSAFASRQC